MRKWAKGAASVGLFTMSLAVIAAAGMAPANAGNSAAHLGGAHVLAGSGEVRAGSEISLPYKLRVDACDRALAMFGATNMACANGARTRAGAVMDNRYRTLTVPVNRDVHAFDSDESTTTPRLPTRSVEPGLNAYQPTQIPVDAENHESQIPTISKERASLDPTRVAPAATVSEPAQETGPSTLFGLLISVLLAAAAVLMTAARRIRLGRW